MNNRKKETVRKLLVVFGALLLLVLFTGNLWAQDKKPGGVIRLEVTTIQGRVQKPNAFFINTRRSLVYETIEVKDSFLDEITKVVDSGDF